VTALLIVNPRASRVTATTATAVLAELAARGPVEQVLTEHPGHAAEIARAACRDHEAIYVLAGDGGFNEAANGMNGSVPIGFIPGGASNVLPRALGLPNDAIDCARRLARSPKIRTISLGAASFRGERRRFTFAAGIGLDAELVRAVDARGRKRGQRPGDLAFVSELIRILARRRGRLEPVLTVEEYGRAAFVVLANCDPYTYAGPLPVRALPRARFELGLDLVAPRRAGPVDVAKLAWWVLVRPTHPSSSEVIYVHDADRLSVRCDGSLPLEVDGEDLGDVTEAVFEAERGALRVLA
jgi:diacylglycerol kinase family enzyme